jgi:glycosyltransferase involved in cell wall biosynthesis
VISIWHVITSLDVGGAERTLERLLRGTDSNRFSGSVVSLLPRGAQAEAIEQQGWPVRSLDLTGAFPTVRAVPVLRQWFRRSRPDIVQTWMYHADLLGGLAARSAGCHRVAWNVRRSVFPTRETESKVSTRSVARTCLALSRSVPRLIVCGSHSAKASHAALGYPEEKLRVIPNGVEIAPPAPSARRSVREELGLRDKAIIIGRNARYDWIKDHASFLQAAALLVQRGFNVHFLLWGENVCDSNRELAALLRSLGLLGRCHLLGRRDDVERLHASLDIACSSSIGEGFPNVVAEAMAAGVPSVVTDVGDSAMLVGDTGRVVPPRSPSALADAMGELIAAGADKRRRMGQSARRRIAARFSLDAMIEAYEELYEELMEDVRPWVPVWRTSSSLKSSR